MPKDSKKRSAPSGVTSESVRSSDKELLERPLKRSKASTSKTISMPKRTALAKKSSKPRAAKESSESEASEQNEEDSEEDEDGDDEPAESTHLKGFSDAESSDSDSDDDDGVDDVPVDVAKLPTVAKDDATVQRKLAKARKQQAVERGVVYLGRIPHGFYEDQMRGYFSQFGEITRVRLSRNKKTGRSKHYGYLEFASAPVAEIVCETMNNYLLMGHILVCEMIPKDRVHPELWVGANRKWRKVPTDRVARVSHNRERDEKSKARVEARLMKRQQQKQERLKAAGIDYDIAAVGTGYSLKPVEAT
ncbi:hypothetical protein DL93DRAFT_1378088 [Clavulina sp. PMI_390]|nr:hypothetical protein DL93DRAFT_1378088 [Clavulina sp. PMI_390]